jgi:hypothetical protein
MIVSRKRLKAAVRRVGRSSEISASLRGRDPGSRGTFTVGRRYEATQ